MPRPGTTPSNAGPSNMGEERAMDVGMMMIFASYGWDNIADDQVWDEDLRLGARRRS